MRTAMLAGALGALVGAALAAGVLAAEAQNQTLAVAIDNFTFNPQTLTVKAGTTVTWTNKDDIPHADRRRRQTVQIEGAGHRQQLFVHLYDTGNLCVFLLASSAHDRHDRGRSGNRRSGALMPEGPWPPLFTPSWTGTALWQSIATSKTTRRGVFATPRCRISTTSSRWHAISCVTRRTRRTRCKSAICGLATFRQLSGPRHEALAADDFAKCLQCRVLAARQTGNACGFSVGRNSGGSGADLAGATGLAGSVCCCSGTTTTEFGSWSPNCPRSFVKSSYCAKSTICPIKRSRKSPVCRWER